VWALSALQSWYWSYTYGLMVKVNDRRSKVVFFLARKVASFSYWPVRKNNASIFARKQTFGVSTAIAPFGKASSVCWIESKTVFHGIHLSSLYSWIPDYDRVDAPSGNTISCSSTTAHKRMSWSIRPEIGVLTRGALRLLNRKTRPARREAEHCKGRMLKAGERVGVWTNTQTGELSQLNHTTHYTRGPCCPHTMADSGPSWQDRL
jgi:hypothetical protein